MTITSALTVDALEPLFTAGIAHGFTFANFIFDEFDDVSFEVTFPDDYTSDDLRIIFRDHGIDELCDYLELAEAGTPFGPRLSGPAS